MKCFIVIICDSGAYYNVTISYIIPDSYSFFLALLFQVYSWGCNKVGQLGHMNSLSTVPQHVKVLSLSHLSLTLKRVSFVCAVVKYSLYYLVSYVVVDV